MKNENIEWVLGQEEVSVCPLPVYSDVVVAFLDELSAVLRKNGGKEYPDVSSLAFWCRKGNILALKQNAGRIENRIGRGLIFHITPSNVPINFAFSYFFGLLAGNANIVRIPSKEYPQVGRICDAVRCVLEREPYEVIRNSTAFVKYSHDKAWTDTFSGMADGRIIWGGDETIRTIRESPMKPKSVEIVFADRYSMGIIDGETVASMDENECRNLAKSFYNDTYLMDQNACSTPHLILWTGKHIEEAKKKFWNAVCEESVRYSLESIKAVDKYTDLCMKLMEEELNVRSCMRWGNRLYTVELAELPASVSDIRGRYGMFYQYDLPDFATLAPHISARIQTMLYCGVDRQTLLDFVMENHLTGIDRIVPFGKSLDMNVVWDGYDIVGELSRRIVCE